MNEVTPIRRMHAAVARFNEEVLGLPIPDAPTILPNGRKAYAVEHLTEELDEFAEALGAEDVAKAADALIDLIYVAMGRLVEMGITPGAAFDAVHEANMRKERGEVSKRPNSLGYDAVKPDGWTPPNWHALMMVTGFDVAWLAEQKTKAKTSGIYTLDAESYDETMREQDAALVGDPLPPAFGEVLVEEQMTIGRKSYAVFSINGLKCVQMPDWLPFLSPIFAEVAQLRMVKGADYNNGPQLKEYFPFGHYSYAQMCHVKNLRVRSLLAVMASGKKPNFEGLRDTLLDNINYNCFYAEWLDANPSESLPKAS